MHKISRVPEELGKDCILKGGCTEVMKEGWVVWVAREREEENPKKGIL